MIGSPRQSWGVALPAYSEEHFAFCAAFASLVANKYLSGAMLFEIADKAMNELYAHSYVDKDRGMPEFAWKVFTAFDEGEYHHSGDLADVNPEQKYTRSILSAALGHHSGVDG